MDIATLEQIIVSARAALSERKRLERLHAAQVDRLANSSMTRAQTTTYNARASDAAQRATFYERNLRQLIAGS